MVIVTCKCIGPDLVGGCRPCNTVYIQPHTLVCRIYPRALLAWMPLHRSVMVYTGTSRAPRTRTARKVEVRPSVCRKDGLCYCIDGAGGFSKRRLAKAGASHF